MVKRQILIVAEDISLDRSIYEYMETGNTEVCLTSSLPEALGSFVKREYRLVIIDFQFVGTNVLELLRVMRKAKYTPILVITSYLESEEKVALFQAGANAYIEKPVDVTVCAAQAAALIELYSQLNEDSITFGSELIISPLYRQVIIDGIPLDLTRTEFDLLFCLAQHPGQVWSRNQLYHRVWDDTLGLEGTHTVKTHIGNLKKKLTDLGKDYIQNSRGVGYRFVPPADNVN